MSNSTTDLYETKREIINFSKNICEGLSKPEQKFIMDMMYGVHHSQNVLLSDISRSLNEPVKLRNTIERLSDHLASFSDDSLNKIKDNYYRNIIKHIDNEPLVLLDNSEIVKRYGKKFEDMCMVKDASSLDGDILPGYHICEATVVTKKEKQPISLYSKIYSTESDEFKSMNDETFKSIEAVKEALQRKCTFVCDRGYDANTYYNYFLKDDCNDDFIIRLKGNRNLLFKGKSKNVEETAKKRKGKVKMEMYFSKEDKTVYVSHTRVELPSRKGKLLTLVIIYGLGETAPMMLLTNKKVSCKEDLHKIVRAYMSRWRIEENFRFKKEQYKLENMRVRTLHAMNVMNTILMIVVGHIGLLAESIDKKLLVIKMIERGKALKSKAYLWYYQIVKGIKTILRHAHNGIREFQDIRKKEEYKQLQLNL